MSVTFNTQTMKYREDETDPWSPLTVHIDASVDAVVQDEEPTGSENVWFDTSDTTEVSVPTMTDFNTLVTNGTFTPEATDVALKNTAGWWYKIGGLVHIQGWVYLNQSLSLNADISITTLPSAIKPPTSYQTICEVFNLTNGKRWYGRLYGNNLHLINDTESSVSSDSMIVFNATYVV